MYLALATLSCSLGSSNKSPITDGFDAVYDSLVSGDENLLKRAYLGDVDSMKSYLFGLTAEDLTIRERSFLEYSVSRLNLDAEEAFGIAFEKLPVVVQWEIDEIISASKKK